MPWNRERIDSVARGSAPADYAAFEAIGLSEMAGARVLDVGCFDGFNTVLKFAPYSDIEAVVGLDPDADALALARQETDDPRFAWIEGTLEAFDGTGGPFDIVYLSHVFQHLPDKQAAADKILSLLRPGGFVVIKTVDDSLKASAPDPENLMKRVFALYETAVRPCVPHTSCTDRNNGAKCYGILKKSGFDSIAVETLHSNTIGMSSEERHGFFDRMTYFRRHVPPEAGEKAAAEMAVLLERWHDLFLQDDYFFDSPTLVWIAQKPGGAEESRFTPRFYKAGPAYSAQSEGIREAVDTGSSDARFSITKMIESDLADVMSIEVKAFSDPWTPVAYAMELRHNKDAVYMVARDNAGIIRGYVGWWYATDSATIAHIAVDPDMRRQGLGRLLLEEACTAAQNAGKAVMQLQVRSANDTARKFYRALGFEEMSVSKSYYTNPDDDGVIMARILPSKA